MSKKKSFIAVIVIILIIVAVLWVGGIIPKQIAKIYGNTYMSNHFPEMKLKYVDIEWSKYHDDYIVTFKDKDNNMHSCTIGPKYFPINIGQGGFAIEEAYKEKEINNNQNNDTEDEITLSLKEGTLSSKGATFIIKNNSDKKYYYGSQYEIQMKKENEWSKIEIKGLLTWTTEAFMLNSYSSNELKIKFSYGDSELSKGQYRLVKEVNKEKVNPREDSNPKYLYAEFEIK